MNGRERGFLLLSSHLGESGRKPLTASQLRVLADRVSMMNRPDEDRDLIQKDLTDLGYSREMAGRILRLLQEEDVLDYYLRKGEVLGCEPITRVSDLYPLHLRKRLGLESPGVLWARGDMGLLTQPMVALVGSRELREENWKFAAEVGRQAARQSYVLVSGNARGADRTAQESCLDAGGKVICVVADELWKQPLRENVLYVSEDDFEEGFSAQRALSRNRVIHALGIVTFVAQSSFGSGGTWDGTVKNLQNHWSDVYGFDDGSDAMEELSQMGLERIGMEELDDFYGLPRPVRMNMV